MTLFPYVVEFRNHGRILSKNAEDDRRLPRTGFRTTVAVLRWKARTTVLLFTLATLLVAATRDHASRPSLCQCAVDSKAEHSVFSARDARWPRSRFSHHLRTGRLERRFFSTAGIPSTNCGRPRRLQDFRSFLSIFQIQLFYNRYLSNTDPACKHGHFNRLAKAFRTF